jgi:hypothetical protein
VRQEALAVGAISGHLTLVLVGEQRQGGWYIQHWLGERGLQQEAHVGQAEGQAGQRWPGHVVRQRVSCVLLYGPPSLALEELPEARKRGPSWA